MAGLSVPVFLLHPGNSGHIIAAGQQSGPGFAVRNFRPDARNHPVAGLQHIGAFHSHIGCGAYPGTSFLGDNQQIPARVLHTAFGDFYIRACLIVHALQYHAAARKRIEHCMVNSNRSVTMRIVQGLIPCIIFEHISTPCRWLHTAAHSDNTLLPVLPGWCPAQVLQRGFRSHFQYLRSVLRRFRPPAAHKHTWHLQWRKQP